MNFLLTLILLTILIIFIALYFVFMIISNKLRCMLGYKKYEYTKILSYGMNTVYMWHKSDQKALECNKDREFVSEIIPHKRNIKP